MALKTRGEIEAGYAVGVAQEGQVNSVEWAGQVHVLQTMHEIACQLADMNQQMTKPGPGIQVINGDGVVNIHNGTVLITKVGSACAMTLGQPLAGGVGDGGEDGSVIRFVPAVVGAHTITTGVNGINGNKSILTLVPPSSGLLVAYGGVWYLVGPAGGTLSG